MKNCMKGAVTVSNKKLAGVMHVKPDIDVPVSRKIAPDLKVT